MVMQDFMQSEEGKINAGFGLNVLVGKILVGKILIPCSKKCL